MRVDLAAAPGEWIDVPDGSNFTVAERDALGIEDLFQQLTKGEITTVQLNRKQIELMVEGWSFSDVPPRKDPEQILQLPARVYDMIRVAVQEQINAMYWNPDSKQPDSNGQVPTTPSAASGAR